MSADRLTNAEIFDLWLKSKSIEEHGRLVEALVLARVAAEEKARGGMCEGRSTAPTCQHNFQWRYGGMGGHDGKYGHFCTHCGEEGTTSSESVQDLPPCYCCADNGCQNPIECRCSSGGGAAQNVERLRKRAHGGCPCANGQMCAGGANAVTKKKWACTCRTPFLKAQDGWIIEPSSACLWPAHVAINAMADAVLRLTGRLPNFDGAHWINIVVRRGGKDEVYQADYLRALADAAGRKQ